MWGKEYVVLWLIAAIMMKAEEKLAHSEFGKMPDGTAIQIYTLTNHNGIEARITNYGGIITSLKVPDRSGRAANIVLGFDSLNGYLANPGPYFGASSEDTAIASDMRDSRSPALSTRWGRMTGITPSTAAAPVLTRKSGPRVKLPMAVWN